MPDKGHTKLDNRMLHGAVTGIAGQSDWTNDTVKCGSNCNYHGSESSKWRGGSRKHLDLNRSRSERSLWQMRRRLFLPTDQNSLTGWSSMIATTLAAPRQPSAPRWSPLQMIFGLSAASAHRWSGLVADLKPLRFSIKQYRSRGLT